MLKMRALILSVSASIALVSIPVAAQRIDPREPGDTDTPGGVAEMARTLCDYGAYETLGYSSYSECYNDILRNYQPAGGAGGGSGDAAWCAAFTGKTGIPCF